MCYQEAKPEKTGFSGYGDIVSPLSLCSGFKTNNSLGNSVWDLSNSKYNNSTAESMSKAWSERDICVHVSMLRPIFIVAKIWHHLLNKMRLW